MTLSRRTFLRLAGGTGLAAATSGLPTTASATTDLRVYVLVVDGCRPEEVGSGLMPRLAALRAGGTSCPAARSLPVMETIPDHVMMATGVRPDLSGVPANAVYDGEAGAVRELDRPTDLRAPTVLRALREAGRATGTVLSKRYLHGIFSGQATHEWAPAPLVPVSGHAPDAATVDALVDMVDAHDPALVLANLGDVDRIGTATRPGASPSTLPAPRRWRRPTCTWGASSTTSRRRVGGCRRSS